MSPNRPSAGRRMLQPCGAYCLHVEAARVEQRTDLDKLVIEMEPTAQSILKRRFVVRQPFWLTTGSFR